MTNIIGTIKTATSKELLTMLNGNTRSFKTKARIKAPSKTSIVHDPFADTTHIGAAMNARPTPKPTPVPSPKEESKKVIKKALSQYKKAPAPEARKVFIMVRDNGHVEIQNCPKDVEVYITHRIDFPKK